MYTDLMTEIRNAKRMPSALRDCERRCLITRILQRLDFLIATAGGVGSRIDARGVKLIIHSTSKGIGPLSRADDELFRNVLAEFEQLLEKLLAIAAQRPRALAHLH